MRKNSPCRTAARAAGFAFVLFPKLRMPLGAHEPRNVLRFQRAQPVRPFISPATSTINLAMGGSRRGLAEDLRGSFNFLRVHVSYVVFIGQFVARRKYLHPVYKSLRDSPPSTLS